MRLRMAPYNISPTDYMSETLAKGKACLSCRARKSVSTPRLRLAILTPLAFA